MADENKQNQVDDVSEVISEETENVVSEINDESSDSENDSQVYSDEEEYPVQFTKEDVLGEDWDSEEFGDDSDDELDPYTEKEQETLPKTTLKERWSNWVNKMPKPSAAAESIGGKALYMWKRIQLPLAIALISIVAIFSVLYILCSSSIPTDVVAKNVYIEGLDVGGLTYDEALASVKATYLFENQKVTLKCGSQTFEFDGLDIGLYASPEETTQKAFNYAKSDNKFLNGIKAVGLLLHRHTVVPVAAIEEHKLEEKLVEFGNQVHGELIGHYVEIREENEATIWPGHTGFDGDVTAAKKAILEAFDREQFKNITVTFNNAPPPDLTVEKFDLLVYKDPVDAYYKVENNQVEIVPEVHGRYIDKEGVAPLLASVKEGVEPVIVPWNTAYAAITADMLSEKLFNDKLASYSTYYGSSTANRSANVSRAAELLNGAVLNSGEIFSFNTQVGQRTKYNGFYTAPEYVNGQTVQGIGGGTCQVSTTLYSAVLYAGLDIISRTNHMFTVSYAPLGQDATVSDMGVDFQFRNNSNYPIKIKSYTDGSEIYVDIIGTAWEPEKTVKIDHSVSYTSGGTSVYSKRYIYENGECVKDEKLPSSYYKAHPVETTETTQ